MRLLGHTRRNKLAVQLIAGLRREKELRYAQENYIKVGENFVVIFSR